MGENARVCQELLQSPVCYLGFSSPANIKPLTNGFPNASSVFRCWQQMQGQDETALRSSVGANVSVNIINSSSPEQIDAKQPQKN